MFHVAPLLPHVQSKNTESQASQQQAMQQIEKKRHIGNDIVVIIFTESNVPFNLSSVSSKQNHIFVFVRPCPNGYSMTICQRSGVPMFKPDLPDPAVISTSPVGRDFFFNKLVMGERAIYKAPDFAPKLARTRSVLLADIVERFM